MGDRVHCTNTTNSDSSLPSEGGPGHAGAKVALLKPDFALTYPRTVMLPFHMPITGSYLFLSLSVLYISIHLSWQSANEFGQVPTDEQAPINLLPLLSKEHPGKPSSSCAFAIVGFAIQIAVINSHPAEFGWVKREATFFSGQQIFISTPSRWQIWDNLYISVLVAEISTPEGLTKRSLTWCQVCTAQICSKHTPVLAVIT